MSLTESQYIDYIALLLGLLWVVVLLAIGIFIYSRDHVRIVMKGKAIPLDEETVVLIEVSPPANHQRVVGMIEELKRRNPGMNDVPFIVTNNSTMKCTVVKREDLEDECDDFTEV